MRRQSVLVLAVLVVMAGLAPAIADAQGADFASIVQEGSPRLVREALARGADPNARLPDGETPLADAATSNRNPEVVRILLTAGARVDARDSSGMTPLMWAAAENPNPDVTAALLAAGADPNARNVIGITPLMFAAKEGTNPEVAKRLLAAGAMVNAKDINGFTPLMYAASRNDSPALIAALLAAGADANLRNSAGETALQLAQANSALSGGAAIAALKRGAAGSFPVSRQPAKAAASSIIVNGAPRTAAGGRPPAAMPGQPTARPAAPSPTPVSASRRGETAVSVIMPLTTISTYAGGGTAGFTNQPGTATALSLSNPIGLAIDQNGDLYVADSGNNVVRRVAPNGTMTTVAGNGTEGYSGDGGPARKAELYWPQGVAVDSKGDLFISDSENNVVREVLPDGIIRTVAGTGRPGYSGDGGPAASARLDFPTGLALDGHGNLYIADTYNNVIRKVAPSGIITTVAGDGYRASQGSGGFAGDGGPATSAHLNWPHGIALDRQGDLYIADSANGQVRMVNTKGIITTVAGTGVQGFSGDGGPAAAASLDWPSAIALGGDGKLFIADTGNERVREVNREGIISTVVGDGRRGYRGDGGPPPFAELGDPSGLALGARGQLYISDAGNDVVREMAPASGSQTRGMIVFRVVRKAPTRSPVKIALSGQDLQRVYRTFDDTAVTGELRPGAYDFQASFSDDRGIGFAGTATVEAGKETLLTFSLGYSSAQSLAIVDKRKSLAEERERISESLPVLRSAHAKKVRSGLSLDAIGLVTAGASALLYFDSSFLQGIGLSTDKTPLLVTGGFGLGLLATGLIVPLTWPSQAYINQEARSVKELDQQLRQLGASDPRS